MKRLFLLVSILLLVGGAGGAMAEENPPLTKAGFVMPTEGFISDIVLETEVGDLVALGPLVPGKLRGVCAIVGFTPKVKPEMTGVFCYPSAKKGTPARNGYINIFLAWGKLTAPGGGRWTGANKLGPWQSNPDFSNPRQKGWTSWNSEEGGLLWQELAVKNGLSSWPEPVFTKTQLQGRITKTIYGTPVNDPTARLVSDGVESTRGFATGAKDPVGLVPNGAAGWRHPRIINCYFTAERFALAVGPNSEKHDGIACWGRGSSPYTLTFWEPWGPKEVRAQRDT